jgi:ribosomal protein S20
MKKLIATVAVAGLLVVGGAGAAFAADDGGSTGSAPATTQPATGARRAAHPALRRALRRGVLKVSAATIQIDVQELRADLRNGQSIAQVAQSKGVDPKTVVDAIVKAADAKIDALVQKGRISSERAAKVKARVPDLAERAVNRVPKAASAPKI